MNLRRCCPREWKRSIKWCHYYKGLMLLCFRRRVYWPIMVTLFSTFGSCTIRQAENMFFVPSKGFNCVTDDLKYNLIFMILHIDPTIVNNVSKIQNRLQNWALLVVFILRTHYPSGRTWTNICSSSGYESQL